MTLTTCTSARAVQPGLNMTPGRQLLCVCHAPRDDAGADIARRPPGTPGMTTRSTTPSQRPEDALCAGAGPRRGGGEQIHAAKPTRRDASCWLDLRGDNSRNAVNDGGTRSYR